jgi:polyisoprenoid-binding protein YceI
MKKASYLLVCTLLLLCTTAFVLFTANWKVKGDEASVKFTSGKINGSFSGLKANIVFDKEHPEAGKISASIDVPSIATGFFLKNSHAKDALDADTYPTIKFVSASVTKEGTAYVASGGLTMKGVTKPVNIHFTFNEKGNVGVFKGQFKVIPKEFGIDHNGTPPEVTVDLLVPVTK